MAIRRHNTFPATDALVYDGKYIADTSQFKLIDLQYMKELINKDNCFIEHNISYESYNRYRSPMTILEEIIFSKKEISFYTKEDFFQACKRVYIVPPAYMDNEYILTERMKMFFSLISRSKTFEEFEHLYISTMLVKEIIL